MASSSWDALVARVKKLEDEGAARHKLLGNAMLALQKGIERLTRAQQQSHDTLKGEVAKLRRKLNNQ